MIIGWNGFASRDEMVQALADDIARKLVAGVNQNGRASWLVSGGGTPKPLFEAIRSYDLPWQSITIALVDERYVPEGHARSNTSFVKQSLLQDKAAAAPFIPLYDGVSVAADAEKANGAYAQLGAVDSVLLGIGPDGHTASLFPAADGLDAAFDKNNPAVVCGIRAIKSDVTGDEVDRLTVTPKLLNEASQVILMITGSAKKAVLDEAMKEGSTLPIARVMAGLSRPMGVYWAD